MKHDFKPDKNRGYGRRRKSRNRRRRIYCLMACLVLIIIAVYGASLFYKEFLSTVVLTENDKGSFEEGEWSLILVNRWNPLPNSYDMKQVELSNGESVDERIYNPLQKMFDNARTEGIYPVVASGYRTSEKQQSLMDEKIQDYENEGYLADEAKTKAEAWVAIPGTSEHELGLAVDINADGIHSAGDEVYKWLEDNAYKYGFIRRYPSDKTDITGVINEPWHYRYVGVKAAAKIYRKGICLEEYLKK